MIDTAHYPASFKDDLLASFEAFESACKQLMEEPPPTEELEELFDILKEHEIYPVDGGITDERLQYMIDLGKEEGVIEGDLTPDDVLDRRPLERALEMLDA